MKKISIIVPVYNREKQIQRCIDSLVNQTYENIQIILVNDGSKDRSKEIIDMNQKKHPDKIIAIHTENQGVSMARNEGIQVAQGDYIGFVDSDDYVDKEMFCKLIEKAEQDDFVEPAGFVRVSVQRSAGGREDLQESAPGDCGGCGGTASGQPYSGGC